MSKYKAGNRHAQVSNDFYYFTCELMKLTSNKVSLQLTKANNY